MNHANSILGIGKPFRGAPYQLMTGPRISQEFPLSDLFDALSKQRKRPTYITDDHISALLEVKYGQKLSFLILSLLYDEKSWGAVPYDIDHIFPQAETIRSKLMATNLPVSKIEQIIAASAKIGNLQLLSSTENNKKNAQKFADWALNVDSGYYECHLIPQDRHLWDVLMLPEFVREREKLIRKKLLSLSGDVL